MPMQKKQSRLRRAGRSRNRICQLGVPRLAVYRTLKHVYAQISTANGAKILACASTLDKVFKASKQASSNIDAAKVIGRMIAEKALAIGIKKVAFHRSGFKYHGRVKALAEAAREAGLDF